MDIVRALIKAGGEALLLKTEAGGYSCLLVACAHGHLEVVKTLERAGGGAVLFMTVREGCSFLGVACYTDHPEIVKYLINVGGDALLRVSFYSHKRTEAEPRLLPRYCVRKRAS
jgi:ankyrin repeat protein